MFRLPTSRFSGLRLSTLGAILLGLWGTGLLRVEIPFPPSVNGGRTLEIFSGRRLFAQERTLPKTDYYLAFSLYYEGEYKRALKAFQSSARGGLKTPAGRWVDSICYHTMIGECFYQMGDLSSALDQYNSALQLSVAHQEWLLRVEFPPAIRPSQRTPRPAINWGPTQRNAGTGHFPDRMLTLQGNPDNQRVLQQGGVVAPLQHFPVNVTEIMRCTALAMRRRVELMGPVARHDPLTDQLVAAFSRRPVPPNHWSQAWMDVLVGLGFIASGKEVQAVSELQKGLLVQGQLDHPLTSQALLALGHLALQMDQFQAAATYFLEASLAAAKFEQYDTISEALHWGAITHQINAERGVYPPLLPAANWAERNSRQLQASLQLNAAETLAASGDNARASTMLDQARRTVGRRDMASGKLGARMQHLTALLQLQRGKMEAASAPLAQALQFQSNSSPRQLQAVLADRSFTSGIISDRVAMELYEIVLRDPRPKDWNLDPLDQIAFSLTVQDGVLENWFLAAMTRKEHEKALEIADRIRRHRFYRTLDLGGRLLSLRWTLEAPDTSLGQAAKMQRQALLAKYPGYAQLSQQAAGVRQQLQTLPLVANDDDQQKQQEKLLRELQMLSGQQELILHEIAVRRDASSLEFPPVRDVKLLQAEIPPRRLVISFFATKRAVFGFVFSKEQYAAWQIESPSRLRGQVVDLLRELGQHEKNFALTSKDLNDSAWKATAAQLLKALTNDAPDSAWDHYDELIIVPDQMLWYVPFEALQVGPEGETVPLVSKVRIRYAPTVSLVIPDNRPLRPLARTALVSAKLYPREEESVTTEGVEQIRRVLPAVEVISALAGPSSLMATVCDRLIVLADMDDAGGAPYNWTPFYLDRGKPGGVVADWMRLPWGSVEQVILPGFHTPAEAALKRGGTGDELFLAVCGMMASGTRTILLSRWRVGGASSYHLIREFVQELPHTSASDAWQRSVQLMRTRVLDPESEPRVRGGTSNAELRAEHPFFWAGYLLIDQGIESRKK